MDTGELTVGLLLLRAAFVIEALKREEIAVVGYRQSGHAELARPFDERYDLALSVQKRVSGMQVKMDEIGHNDLSELKALFRKGMGEDELDGAKVKFVGLLSAVFDVPENGMPGFGKMNADLILAS